MTATCQHAEPICSTKSVLCDGLFLIPCVVNAEQWLTFPSRGAKLFADIKLPAPKRVRNRLGEALDMTAAEHLFFANMSLE